MTTPAYAFALKSSPIKAPRTQLPCTPTVPAGVAGEGYPHSHPSPALPSIQFAPQPQLSSDSTWNIPAVHNHNQSTEDEISSSTRQPPAPPTTNHNNAATKVGRRQAWLKFMAYEGAVQICIDVMLSSFSSSSSASMSPAGPPPAAAAAATGFLLHGCRSLREALSVGSLLLPSMSNGGFATETAIYWDDREEGTGSVLTTTTTTTAAAAAAATKTKKRGEKITVHENSMYSDYIGAEERQRQQQSATTTQYRQTEGVEAQGQHKRMTPLGSQAAFQDSTNFPSLMGPPVSFTMQQGGTNDPADNVLPPVAATVVRVVGCPMLTLPGLSNALSRRSLSRSLSIGEGGDASSSSPTSRFSVVMHPAGGGLPSRTTTSWTAVTVSGAVEAPHQGQYRIYPNSPQGTILVELYNGDTQVAAGTVQASALQRCALQHDALDDDAPMAAGFLRNLVPSFVNGKLRSGGQGGCGGRRSFGCVGVGSGIIIGASSNSSGSNNNNSTQEVSSSMTWVRLVDGKGGDAGHVVVAAKTLPFHSIEAGTTSSTGTPPISVGPSPQQVQSMTPTNKPAPTSPPQRQQRQQPSHKNGHMSTNTTTTTTVLRTNNNGPSVGGGQCQSSAGYLHVNAQHVYDILLEAALASAGCGPSSLTLAGPWEWLVREHAKRFGVRDQYATLAHLRWVVRMENSAPSALCFSTLATHLGPLLQQRDTVSLASAELAILSYVLERVDGLLTSCFENYYALNESTPGGLVQGMLSVREPGAAPALRPAVHLLHMTRSQRHAQSEGGGGDHAANANNASSAGADAWLAARFRCAARKRFQALLAAIEARRSGSNAPKQQNQQFMTTATNALATHDLDQSTVWAYGRVEELCSCIINELRADESIAADGVLPPTAPLPAITAVEYIKGSISFLHSVLQSYPPPAPSPAAIRLVESVGYLQSFVERHQFSAAVARLNSREIFGGFITEWIESTATALRRTLRAFDREGPPALSGWADLQTGVKSRVSPLIEGMLSEVEAEMKRYARIVSYWPGYGQELEASVVAVLREATAAASAQCGLVQTKVDEERVVNDGKQQQQDVPVFMHRAGGKPPPMPGSGAGKRFGGRVAWRWIQVGSTANGGHSTNITAPVALRKGIAPHQALLLNSLRRLLAVVPQLELSLRDWCLGGHPSGGSGEHAAAEGATTRAHHSVRQCHASFPPALSPEKRISRDAPDLGAQFSQLVKELRTEYYACCTLTVESMAAELVRSKETSVNGVLRREASSPVADLTKHVRRALDLTTPTLRWLAAALDGRVFVALARGLWDNAARDVLRFAEDLSDSSDHSSSGTSKGGDNATQMAWRCRQGASAVLRSLDAFYRTELASAMGSDLLDKDLAPPQHAQRAAALLADATTEVGDMSFDVY